MNRLLTISIISLTFCLINLNICAQTGPGGVGTVDGTSTLEGWYKGSVGIEEAPGDAAEIGDLVITWTDQSGNGNDLTLIANDVSPFYSTYLGFNCLEFTTTVGTERKLVSLSPTGASVSNVSIFSVFATSGTNSNERPVGVVTDPAWSAGLGDNFSQAAENSIRKDNGNIQGIIPGVAAQKRVRSSLMAPGDVEDFVDGALNISSASSYTTQATTLFRVGHVRNKGNTPRVYETMYFSSKVNDAQRIIIDNYLSAKYGTVMTDFDAYDEDDGANGDYDNEVAGIGRVDAANIHDESQGESIIRILNPQDLDDNEFLHWGHDNASLALTATNIPPAAINRLTRIWRASEMSAQQVTVDVGCMDMRFDLTGLGAFTAAELVILADSDGDGLFSDEIPVPGATDLGGNIFEFANISCISDNIRFTLGMLDPTYVFPPDLVASANDTIPCMDDIVEFNVLSNVFDQAIQIDWDFGDLNTSSGLADTVNHPYLNAGTYTIECIVYYPCKVDTITMSIEVTNCVLPIELVDFKGACNENSVDLIWNTVSEFENDYFTIERSINGIDFETLTTVNGGGTSSSANSYSWRDNNPSAQTAYYRLSQTDYNGTTEYFQSRTVSCNNAGNIIIYPNPFEDHLTITSEFDGVITLFDVSGKLVFEKVIGAGKNVFRIETLASGSYIAHVVLDNGSSKKVKLVKF